MEALYYSGQQIEVPGEKIHNAWYTAKVVETFREENHKKNSSKKKLLIEYEKIVDTETSIPLKETFDAERVRPKPPQIMQNVFHLNQVVDAFFANGWWKGKIVRVLEGLRYIVFLDSPIWRFRFQKIPVTFDGLRVHQDWVGGRWYRIMPKDMNKDQVQLFEVGNNISTTRKRNINQADAECSTKAFPPCKKSYNGGTKEDSHSLVDDTQKKIITSDLSILTSMEEKAPQKQAEHEDTVILSSQSEGLMDDHLQPNLHVEEKEHYDSSKRQLQNNRDFQPHELGQPKDVVENYATTLDIPKEQAEEIVLETFIHDSTDNQLAQSLTEPPYLIKCSMNQSLNHIEDDHNCEEVTAENGNLIFTKSLSIWKYMELAMKEMCVIPQNPHFRPLEETNMYLREGKAVGYMISFIGLVEKTKRAQFDEPKGTLEEKLLALDVFEALGFNVQHVRVRIDELLRIKTSQVQIDEMLKQCEEEIVEKQSEEKRLDSEIGEVDERILEIKELLIQMNEKRRSVEMEKISRSCKMDALEMKAHETKSKIQDAIDEFHILTAAPW